jgi:hypothetical protein
MWKVAAVVYCGISWNLCGRTDGHHAKSVTICGIRRKK